MKIEKNLIALVVLLVVSALPGLGGQESGDRVGYHDTIVVAAGEVRDNVITFGGDIIVEGKVRRNVLAVGGTITVSGEVGDSVVGIGARIILKSTAAIRGDLVGLGGTLEKESGYRVDGDTVYFKGAEISDKVFKEGLRSILSFSFWPVLIILKMVNVFIWFLLAFLAALLFPKQLTSASNEVRKHFWPIFGTGLLAQIIFTFLSIFAAILCLLLIGIPILFALAIVGFIIKVFGRVVILVFFGESLARAFHWNRVSALGAAMLGLLLVSLIGFIPVFGFLFTMALSFVGWGVVIRTKFGTTENWFRRTPPPSPPAVV
jgi:hypothetical protein